jgi:hypothetical protein
MNVSRFVATAMPAVWERPHGFARLRALQGPVEAAARDWKARVRRSSLRRHDPDQVRRVFLSPRPHRRKHPRFLPTLKHEAGAMASAHAA